MYIFLWQRDVDEDCARENLGEKKEKVLRVYERYFLLKLQEEENLHTV